MWTDIQFGIVAKDNRPNRPGVIHQYRKMSGRPLAAKAGNAAPQTGEPASFRESWNSLSGETPITKLSGEFLP